MVSALHRTYGNPSSSHKPHQASCGCNGWITAYRSISYFGDYYPLTDLMKQTFPTTYYSSVVDSLHNNWVNTLKDLRAVSEPSARELYLEDLTSIYSQARSFAAQNADHIDGIRAVKLEHILQRPLEQHIAIARHNDVSVMGDYRQPHIPNPNTNGYH